MSIAVYPGSFDPVTMGHLDIIRRASAIFDTLVVACMVNVRKKTTFTVEERVEMLRCITTEFPNVQVDSSPRLLADYARELRADIIVKGLRAMSDFEMEFQMALLNRKMNPKLDTLFLTAGESFQYLSSSAIKEIGQLGGDMREFIPPEIYDRVAQKIRSH